MDRLVVCLLGAHVWSPELHRTRNGGTFLSPSTENRKQAGMKFKVTSNYIASLGPALDMSHRVSQVIKKKKKYFEKMKQVWVAEVPLNPCLKMEVDILYHKAIVRGKHV